MKSILRIAVAAVAALSFSVFAATVDEAQLPLTDGTIKKLDPAAAKVTIAHGTIANLNMPPMTMTFKARKPELLAKLKAGDKVRFRAVEADGILTVISIDAAK